MKRVLHVCKSKIYAGAEAVAIQIINSLSDNYEFAYCSTEGSIREKLKRENITYYPVHNFNFIELKKVIKFYKPVIIHAHDFSASIICSLFSGEYKVISHIHHNSDWIKYWSIKSIMYKLFMNRFSKIVLVSNVIKKEAIFFTDSNRQVVIVGNPINVKEINFLADKACHSEKYDILFIGRLVSEKDPLRFINIVNMVCETETNIKAALIGDGDLYSECKDRINKLGLSKNIKLLGFKENPYGLLKNCRVLCVTSKWEGFGLVASEAKALATPILLPPVGGLLELFDADAEEYCRSDKEFSEKIKMLLNNCNYEIWKERAKQSSQLVDNTERYMNAMENIYKEIVL